MRYLLPSSVMPQFEHEPAQLNGKNGKIKFAEWKDPFEEALPYHARALYLRMLSLDTRKKLVTALEGVPRWGWEGQKVNPEFTENDLDHEVTLVIWLKEIENKYPELWAEVCDGKLADGHMLYAMMIAHDIGETVPGIGDICRSDPRFTKEAGRLHKKREAEAARRLLSAKLDSKYAHLMLKLYERYDARRPDDKLVMLGHMLDKGQASSHVPVNVIPFNMDNPNYDIQANFKASLGDTLVFAQNLSNQLKSEVARRQLKEFLMEKIVRHFLELLGGDRGDEIKRALGEFDLKQDFPWLC